MVNLALGYVALVLIVFAILIGVIAVWFGLFVLAPTIQGMLGRDDDDEEPRDPAD